MSDLQAGQAVPGTSHLSADLRRYVSRLVQQYMSKRIGTLVNAGPATDSPVLGTEMVEEDRLAWQQLATGPHLRLAPDGDHPMLGDNDDVTGDDWESLDAEDFLMGEADPKQDLPTDRQVPQTQPRQLVQQPHHLSKADRSFSCTEAVATIDAATG